MKKCNKSTMPASLTILILLVVFCSPLCGATTQLEDQIGENNFEILKNARFITILSMVPERAQKSYTPVKEVNLSYEEMEKLKRNLLDDHNYDFGRVKKCRFIPEISFKFEDAEGQVVHLFVSPSCNQILFGMGAESTVLNYDPAHVRLEHFLQQLVTETRNRNKETLTWQ